MPTTKVLCPVWKVCPRCEKRKRTKKAFYPDKQNRTGYRTYCIGCVKGGRKADRAAAQ